MAAILPDDIFKCIFLMKIPIQMSLKCVPMSPIDSNPALVKLIVWRWIGDRPLPEPEMIQFTDA